MDGWNKVIKTVLCYTAFGPVQCQPQSPLVTHLKVLQGVLQLLRAAVEGASGGQEGLRLSQQPPQFGQTAGIQSPVAHQRPHQAAALLGTLDRALPVLTQLGQLQEEVAPAESRGSSVSAGLGPPPTLLPAAVFPGSCFPD